MCADALTWLGRVLLVIGGVILVLVVVPIVVLIAVAFFSKGAKLVAWDDLDPTVREQHTVRDPEGIEALLNPDWDAYREQYGSEPPRAIVELYRNHDFVLCQDFVLCPETEEERSTELDVWGFVPMRDALHVPKDLADLNQTIRTVGQGGLYFARNTMGDTYWVRPVEFQDQDGPVYLAHPGDDRIKRACGSLQQFLDAERLVDPGRSGCGCIGMTAHRGK